MSPESQYQLKEMLVKHEGYRQFPYKDTTGHLTVGIGRNLDAKGISMQEALYLFDQDISYFTEKLSSKFPFFENLSDVRKMVLVDMCFNLGVNGLSKFTNMMDAIEGGDWIKASHAITKSKAYAQAPDRYMQLANMMKYNKLS